MYRHDDVCSRQKSGAACEAEGAVEMLPLELEGAGLPYILLADSFAQRAKARNPAHVGRFNSQIF